MVNPFNLTLPIKSRCFFFFLSKLNWFIDLQTKTYHHNIKSKLILTSLNVTTTYYILIPITIL